MGSKKNSTKTVKTQSRVASSAEAREDKVNAVDETRVSIDEITGDNILEKIINNPVARINRDVAKYGTVEEQRARKEEESK